MENKTLKHIEIENIIPNPNNPRLIFHEKDLEDLKQSIANAGVLVPITVYKDTEYEGEGERYILLDGERRWRSCKMLGKKDIPANIIDKPKDITENILHMFNIHYFREQWELFPTALKLENIIELLKTDKDSILSKTTGLSLTTVKRCKILLWYPQKYRETLLYKKNKISTDFFIELFPIINRLNKEPEFKSDIEISKIIDGLITKFTQSTGFSDVKEFREMRKAIKYYDTKGQLYEFIEMLNEFITDPELTMDHFTVLDIEIEKLKSTVLKSISNLNQALTEDNIELLSDYYVLDQLIALEERLKEVIVKIR